MNDTCSDLNVLCKYLPCRIEVQNNIGYMQKLFGFFCFNLGNEFDIRLNVFYSFERKRKKKKNNNNKYIICEYFKI